MGSTSGSASVPAAEVEPEWSDDDVDLIDLDRLTQSAEFGALDASRSDELLSLTEWCARGRGDSSSEDESTAREIHELLDAILHQERRSASEKQKLDSRTFVRPRRRSGRPGLHALLHDSPRTVHAGGLTYNKYTTSSPLRPIFAPHNGRSEESDETDCRHTLSRPIDIDLSQPANSLHTTLTRGVSGGGSERDSLGMFRSGGASILNSSPPSLVSSLVDDSPPDAGARSAGPGSLLASMTLSILEERDMSTSFLSQSTCTEREHSLLGSLLGSLPPSMPSSLDSSWRPNPPLDSAERLTSRPRADLFTVPAAAARNLMNETVSVPHSRALPAGLMERNGTFDKEQSPGVEERSGSRGTEVDNEIQRTVNLSRGDRDLLDQRELSEIVQARHKLSLARSGLSPDQPYPTRTKKTDDVPRRNATFKKRSPLPSNTALEATVIYVRGQSEADPELSPRAHDDNRTLQQEEWRQRCAMVGSSDSTDTATLSSSSPPEPAGEQVPARNNNNNTDDVHERNARRQQLSLMQQASTPLGGGRPARAGTAASKDFLQHISPIPPATPARVNTATMVRRPSPSASMQTPGAPSPQPRSIPSPSAPSLQPRSPQSLNVKSPTRSPQSPIGVNAGLVRRSGLPTSKLRQYSSHKELSRLPGETNAASIARGGAHGRTGGIQRRTVYASNPALSPTAPAPQAPTALQRRDSYTISVDTGPQVQVGVRAPVPALVRQGTETLRRPQSQLLLHREAAVNGAAQRLAATARFAQAPGAVASLAQLRVRGAASARPVPVVTVAPAETRGSGLSRRSRLPAPRRTLRPPSVYSVAPAGDAEHY